MNNAFSETMLPQISHSPQQMLPLAPLILMDAVLDLQYTLSPLIKDHLIMDIAIIVVRGVDVMQLMATHVMSDLSGMQETWTYCSHLLPLL